MQYGRGSYCSIDGGIATIAALIAPLNMAMIAERMAVLIAAGNGGG